MTRALATMLACAAVVLAGGCGSSGSSSTAASQTATTATGTTAATSSTTTGSTASTGTSPGHIKANTTPSFGAPSPSAPVKSGLVQIAYRNITIQPDTLRVKAGSTIRWTNTDAVEHNVTSRSGPQKFASGNFGEGKTFQITVTKPGVIHYLCTIHPTSMNGTIEVVR
jgi:plastocyanin